MFTKAGLLYEKVNYRYLKKAIFVRHLRQNPLFFSLIVALLCAMGNHRLKSAFDMRSELFPGGP